LNYSSATKLVNRKKALRRNLMKGKQA
jgi:hypothetical protein